MEFLICIHIKISCSCQSEEDRFFFPCFFTFKSFVNRNFNRMTAFRSRQNAFYSRKLLCRFKYLCLFYRTSFHISIFVKLR